MRSPLGLPVLHLVPFACMPSPLPRQVRWKLVRSCDSIVFGLPRNRGGSAPALRFSRPAQRLLTLRPACSPNRQCDLLHRRLQQLRCLRHCFDCYRVERTSPRAGIPPLWTTTFHGAPGWRVNQGLCKGAFTEGADAAPISWRWGDIAPVVHYYGTTIESQTSRA